MKRVKKRRTPDRTKVPAHYRQFAAHYPDVASKYEALSETTRSVEALDTKTAALVKLGIAIGLRHQGAVHSHTRKSLKAGASKEEIRHTAILSLTTIGFPSMMAALSWVDDILENR